MTTHGLLRTSGLAFLLLFAVGSLLWWPWGGVRAGAEPAAIARFFADSQDRLRAPRAYVMEVTGGGLQIVVAAMLVGLPRDDGQDPS